VLDLLLFIVILFWFRPWFISKPVTKIRESQRQPEKLMNIYMQIPVITS